MEMEVFEPGALIDRIDFLGMQNSPAVYAGDLTSINIEMRNSGESALIASFKGAVRRKNTLIGMVEGPATEILPGQDSVVEMVYVPNMTGEYTITGRIYYNNKASNEQQASFMVVPREGQSSTNWGMWFMLIVYLVLFISIIFMLRKILKSRMERR